ncbi:MAG: glycosyl hydrolase family 18 protein [Acidobacteriaceae bacterium]
MQRRAFLQSAFFAGAISVVGRPLGRSALLAADVRPTQPNATRRNLYILGQFEQTDPAKLDAVVASLGQSSFNVLTLAFLGIDASQSRPQLLYNGHSFAALSPRLPEMFQHLRTGSGLPRKVLLSIGGWKNTAVFAAIRSMGAPAFVRQLTQEVIAPLHLDGIDLDLEPMQGGLEQWSAAHREYSATLVALTNEYKRVHPSHVVSHAPIAPVAAEFYAKDTAIDGLGKGLLASTRTRNGNHVDWLNVQLYEGGKIGGGSSEEIASFYKTSLAVPLLQMRAQTGIAQPLHFLQPTFDPGSNPPQPLEFCAQTLRSIREQCAPLHAGALGGVSLWQYQQVQPGISAWSKGLEEALEQSAG